MTNLCLTRCYLPIPAREWSRVQHRCTFDTNEINPINPINPIMTAQMLNKGNVLQYKGNSSQLTQKQRYAKIARGQWTNRTTTWATQSTSYTNPNTLSLKRTDGAIKVLIDPATGSIVGPTDLPLSCLPNAVPLVVEDGGSLLCSVYENKCTGEIRTTESQQMCHPAADSDVPGQAELCWNDGTPTWFPKSQTTMTNSGNKFPVNAPLSSAIKPSPPILLQLQQQQQTTGNRQVEITISFQQDQICLPVSFVNLFQNGRLLQQIPISLDRNTFTATTFVNRSGRYTYAMNAVASGGQIVSLMSNVLTATVVIF